jgi:hypothetical protein
LTPAPLSSTNELVPAKAGSVLGRTPEAGVV